MAHKNITQLGKREAEFLALMSSKNAGAFAFVESVGFWKSQELAKKKLHLLEKKGWLARIERGKYLVIPLEAGPARQWSQDEYIVAQSLVQPAAVSYWTAIHHWGWTEQIPRVVYIQTTKRKKSRKKDVFGVTYEFVTVPKRKFFGHSKEWRDGKQILVTDKEKTLVDCADDVERAGGIQELVKAVKAASKEISWALLNEYADRIRNGAVKKRLGFLFETIVPHLSQEAESVMESWRNSLSAGIAPLYPSLGRKGKISTRWGIIDNVGLK